MNPASDPDDSPHSDTALDEALVWFTRLRDGGLSPAEQAAFEAWFAAHPAHAAAYVKVRRLWHSPALSAALSHFDTALPAKQSRRPRYRPRRWLAAASVALMFGWGLFASDWLARWQADYSTVAGQQRTLELADGSTVTLNTDSAIALVFTDQQRGVRLLAGEAYFQVQPDSAKPFIVESGQARVRVVGTRFSVRAGENAVVDVESGTVACANGNGSAVSVTAGQQTTINRHGVAAPEPLDASTRFAWVKGRLVFRDQTLAQVVEELDRYRPGAIFIANAKLAQTRITGNYKLGDSTAILRALADIANARVFTVTPYLTVLR